MTYVKVYMPREMKQLLTEIAKKEAYSSLSEFFRSLARYKLEEYIEKTKAPKRAS